ncbi:MAG: sulfite exporter TauE/SafE family protein [Firmicutes bacterium]|nr:sulfite exporter TauE/SafE family protein [Bacillota bacterium]
MGFEQITFPLAFGAGIVSFVSPCVLPLIPAYVTYLTGSSLEELESSGGRARSRLFLNGLFFVLGFSIVFVAMGMGASAVGRFLTEHLPLVRRLGGLAVIAFGLYMMGVWRALALDRERRFKVPVRSPGPLNSLLLGATFSAGWTPCIGPVLGSVLVLASTASTAVQGGLLLLAYAAGLAVPFLVLTVSLHRLWPWLRRLLPHAERIRVASGVLLVILGVMVYTNSFVLLNNYFSWGF